MRKTVVLLAAVALASAAGLAALATAQDASAAPGDGGASFSVRCGFSHRASDDPIAHYGHPRMAHRHDFFGNRSTDAYSTYRSLIKADTTCTRPGDTAAYWIPTVSFDGRTLEPNRTIVYYRAGGKDHKQVRPYPAGLKMISASHYRWSCGSGAGTKAPPERCSSGDLTVRIGFRDCSNGRRDSADHMSHMAYSRVAGDGTQRCPESHPRPVPTLNMNVTFPVPTTAGEVTLSSGNASSFHADFFNAFDQEELGNLVQRCINDVPPSDPRPEYCQTPAR